MKEDFTGKKRFFSQTTQNEFVKLNPEEKKRTMEDLRKLAREKYVNMRESQQLELFKRKIEEQKKLYKMVQMTEKEKELLELDEKIFKMVVETKEAQEDQLSSLGEWGNGYNPPPISYTKDGQEGRKKKMQTLQNRYVEPKEKEKAPTELWELQQIERAKVRLEALTKEFSSQQQKNYDLIVENQIDFVREEVLEELKMAKEDQEAPKAKSQQSITKGKNSIETQRKQLPIFLYKDKILDLLQEKQTLVLVGETGSGKTTQLPQFLHECGYTKAGKIGCTQPRRVAAMSVAARVATEMGVKLGKEVGYSIRFEDQTSEETIIKYMTDGMLLRELMNEPDLHSYSVIIIDEAHERTLHTDILLALVKDLSRARSDLKVIISSATMNAEKFAEYFDDAPIIRVPGRRFPVDIFYTKAPEADYVDAAVVTALQIHVTQPLGDILVFLTGQDEIEAAEEQIHSRTRGLGAKIKELLVLPIYSSLPSEQQAKIFEPTPPNVRKIVLATNIAETSITIDNIVYVIDCGFSKQTSFNPRTGVDSLTVTPISKASANQRAGRAGRVSKGLCFRLYTLWSFQHELEDNTIPEIQRSNLTTVILSLKAMGIHNLVKFDFMDPPPHEMLIRSLEQLYALGALSEKNELTRIGRKIAEFPVDPQMAKMIVESEKFKCVEQILIIASMLSVGNAIFYRPNDREFHADNARLNFHHPGGDHLGLLNVFLQWRETNYSHSWCYDNFIQTRSMKRALDVFNQLEQICEKAEIDSSNPELSTYVSMKTDSEYMTNILKCIVSGFFFNAAKKKQGTGYRVAKRGNHTVLIHPSSFLAKEEPEWVVFNELVYTTKDYMRTVINVCLLALGLLIGTIWLRIAEQIDPEWLVEIAPHYYSVGDVFKDEKDKKKKKSILDEKRK